MTFFKSIEFPELALTLAEAFDEPELLEDDADDAEESVKVLTSELAVNEPMAFVNWEDTLAYTNWEVTDALIVWTESLAIVA